MQDVLRQYGELGLGSRLKRLSDMVMRDIQLVYDHFQIDFDPYLFPVFKSIIDQKKITATTIQEQLQYTQPAISQALKKLLDKKLVAFIIDQKDHRKKIFKLTRKGAALHKKITPLWKVIDEQVKWLTEGSAPNLHKYLSHLEDQLKEKSLSQRIIENYDKPL